MKVTYIENVTREVTVELEPDEVGMDVSEIDDDDSIRQRVFERVACADWDAEEVHEINWELSKYD